MFKNFLPFSFLKRAAFHFVFCGIFLPSLHTACVLAMETPSSLSIELDEATQQNWSNGVTVRLAVVAQRPEGGVLGYSDDPITLGRNQNFKGALDLRNSGNLKKLGLVWKDGAPIRPLTVGDLIQIRFSLETPTTEFIPRDLITVKETESFSLEHEADLTMDLATVVRRFFPSGSVVLSQQPRS